MRPLITALHLLRMNAAHNRVQLQFVFAQAAIAPAAVYYLGTRLSGGDGPTQTRWLAGAATIGVGVSSLSLAGMSVLLDRLGRRTALLRSVGISPAAYVLVQLANALVAGLVFGGAFLGIAAGQAPVARLIAVSTVLACACGAVAAASIGVMVASRARGIESGASAVMVGAYGLLLVSPVFYDARRWPGPLEVASWISPLTHVSGVLQAALLGAAAPRCSVVALVLLAVLFGAASIRWSPWDR